MREIERMLEQLNSADHKTITRPGAAVYRRVTGNGFVRSKTVHHFRTIHARLISVSKGVFILHKIKVIAIHATYQ